MDAELVEPVLKVAVDTLRQVSGVEPTSPMVDFLRGVAATLAALVSAYSIYKAWRYAEKRLGLRLNEFIDKEEDKLAVVRDNIRLYRVRHGTLFEGDMNIYTDGELNEILARFKNNRVFKIEQKLEKALQKSLVREDKARKKVALHREQRAVAHLLLGARLVRRGEHLDALTQFKNALLLNPNDLEALDYAGHQHIRLGEPDQARQIFQNIIDITDSKLETAGPGDELEPIQLVQSRAYRSLGLAYEALDNPENLNAYNAYTSAVEIFPETYGPLIDLADMHLLRGQVALKQGFTKAAPASLNLALDRFERIERQGGEFRAMAIRGQELVAKALG